MTFNEIELDTHIRCAHAMEPSEAFENNFTPIVDSTIMTESILTSDEVKITVKLMHLISFLEFFGLDFFIVLIMIKLFFRNLI